MAFGDALRATDGATVVLNVDTSQTAKLEAAERQWRESVGTMSREAIKLDLAQDRLKKSLSAYGAESSQAKRATIALKDAEEQAARAADRTTREFREQERALERLNRGATRGQGIFRRFGGVITLAAGSLGTAGFVYAAKQALDAASSLEEQQDFANRTFRESIAIVRSYATDALGLARDEAYKATGGLGALLVPLIGNRTEAAKLSVQLTKLGVDLASIRDTRVEDSLAAIRSGLVGESEPLRQYAVLLSEAKVQQEALRQTGKESATQLTEGEKVLARVNLILREAAYAQGNYADTIESSANQEREAQKNWRNTSILIGDTLQPAYRELLRRVNEYLGSAENQREIQEQVNRAVDVGEDVVRGFAGALRVAKGAVDPLVDTVGGLENAIKLATLAFVAVKVKAAIGFAGTAAASALAARKMIADAVAVNAAWNVATRPRILGVAAAGGAVAGGGRGIPPILLGNPALLTVTAILTTPSAGGAKESDRRGIRRGLLEGTYAKKFPRITRVVALAVAQGTGALTPVEREAFRRAWNASSEAELAQAEQVILNAGSFVAPDTADPRRPGTTARPGRTRPSPSPRASGPGRRTLEDIQLDQARAAASPGTADDVRFLREERALLQRQIGFLERRKTLTAEQKQKLTQLYGDLRSVQSELDAIVEAEEAKLEAQKKVAREKREREAARRAKEEQAALDRFERQGRQRDLARARRFGATGGFGGALGGAELARRQRARATASTAGGGMTQEEIRALFASLAHQFLLTFEANQRAYGSNFSSGNELSAAQQLHVQRSIERGVHHLAAGSRFTEHIMARELTGAYFDSL